jgi:hypothetical protein
MTAAANLITMLAPARPSLRGLGERERLLVGHALCLAVEAMRSEGYPTAIVFELERLLAEYFPGVLEVAEEARHHHYRRKEERHDRETED